MFDVATSYDPYCVICSQRVGLEERVYRQVTGFIRPRKQGGTNALKRQEATGRVAHIDCVERGVPPGQATLLDT